MNKALEHGFGPEEEGQVRTSTETIVEAEYGVEASEEPLDFDSLQRLLEKAKESEEWVVGDDGTVLEIKRPETAGEPDERYSEAEEAFFEEWIGVEEEAKTERFDVLKKMIERAQPVLQKLEIETPGKAAIALLELVPKTGIPIAMLGVRLKDISREGVTFQKLTTQERLLYLVGELSPVPGTQTALTYALNHERVKGVIDQATQSVKDAYQLRTKTPLIGYVA